MNRYLNIDFDFKECRDLLRLIDRPEPAHLESRLAFAAHGLARFAVAFADALPSLWHRHLDGRDGLSGRHCARINGTDDGLPLLKVPCDCGALEPSLDAYEDGGDEKAASAIFGGGEPMWRNAK